MVQWRGRLPVKVLGITGTPGTGKSSIAPIVARKLGFSLKDLNSLALSGGLAGTASRNEVDPKDLRTVVMKGLRDDSVIVGHMLPDVLKRNETTFVAVLRCSPAALKGRLAARRYRDEQLIQNVEAEFIGVLLGESILTFGERAVHEYDTTHADPATVSDRIAKDYLGKRKPRIRRIDWTEAYNSAAKLTSLLSSDSTESALT